MTNRVPLNTANLAGALAQRATTPEWRERLAALARGDGDGNAPRRAAQAVPRADSLGPSDHDHLRSRYARRLFADDDRFWDGRRDARYATLVDVGQPERVAPTPVAKPDRRAWVTLDRAT